MFLPLASVTWDESKVRDNRLIKQHKNRLIKQHKIIGIPEKWERGIAEVL